MSREWKGRIPETDIGLLEGGAKAALEFLRLAGLPVASLALPLSTTFTTHLHPTSSCKRAHL